MKSLSLLFPSKFESTKTSLILLASRLVFGLTFASHGLEKLQHFTETAAHFPAPFGLSGDVAVGLSIFGELVCGLAFVFGFLTRLTLLPMIFTMIVAFTTVSGGSVSAGELAFLYLVIFILSWFAGAGKYSIDGFIARKINK
ncbi:DoxX family protein [Prevotella histicola]|uniref:DoxX family protein n=1 Tax=Prevotella histicola TaxID=470565 RepID=UPI0028E3F908|nr:DoxX family protein [Prevotella histicola]